MRSILQLIIKNSLLTAILIITIAFVGFYSLTHMSVDLFPKLNIPVVNIVTHYSGASPEDMETLVSKPVENVMRGIPGVKRITSNSIQGISQVTVEFSWGTTVGEARQLVQSSVSGITNQLPTGVMPRLENIDSSLQEICGFIIYGTEDTSNLRLIATQELSGRLMSIEGVSSIDVMGGDQKAFHIKVSPENLLKAKLSIDQIVSKLQQNNISAVAGYMDKGGKEYLIRGDARLKSIDDLDAIVLKEDNGSPLLLGSVAKIENGYVPAHYVVQGDARPAVVFVVRKQPEASTVAVSKNVDIAVKELKELFPKGTKIKKYYDQSEIIQEAQNEIINDLIIGAILAIIVLYFFLGSLRPTIIVALIIPITFLATIALMNWLDLSLNIITMTALTMAIGMIIDDAIVVAENIFRHGSFSSSSKEASINGTHEILSANISGTITTVVVFLPLLLVTGIAALFMAPFGITVGVSLLISLILSLTLVPVLFSRVKQKTFNDKKHAGYYVVVFLNKILQTCLNLSFRFRWVVLFLSLAFLSLASLVTFLGESSVLPPIDEGSVFIEYILPPGTSLAESNSLGEKLELIALKDTDVFSVYRRIGSPGNGYQIEGVNRGELFIKVKPRNQRKRSVPEISEDLEDVFSKFPGVVFMYHQPTQEKIEESFSGLPALFGITIYGSDMKELISISEDIEEILKEEDDVDNIVNNTKISIPQVEIKLNYKKLAKYEVDAKTILTTIEASRFGIEATHILNHKENIPVLVQLDLPKDIDLKTIKSIPIQCKNNWIPLEKLADIFISHSPAAITRLNGQRQLTIIAEVEGDIPTTVKELSEKFEKIKLPEGYSIDFTGQYKILIKTAKEMICAVIAAIILIYVIMVTQFRSFLQPFIILFTIPISIVGAIIGLFLSNKGLDISVGMGVITLIGISVNNSIVLLDFTNMELKSRKPVASALKSAVSVRLRPILLTSLTTITALLPTAVGTSGSAVFKSFAITVVSGLIFSLLASLVIIPTIYYCFYKNNKVNEDCVSLIKEL